MSALKKPLLYCIAIAAPLSIILATRIGRAAVDGNPDQPPAASGPATSVTLTDSQLKQVKVVAATTRDFVAARDAVGYIDFDQDRMVQVYAPWAGRIKAVFVEAGDAVRKGQPLYSVDSPDLVQAESTLIADAGVLQLTTHALDRAEKMLPMQASAQKDVDQARSDQQTAEASYKAARDAVRIFGKSDADIDAIIAQRRTDGELRIASPINGAVVARNAAPGLLVQPGNAPAPIAVADLSTMWLVASVTEYDLPSIQTGQAVTALVPAYPGRKFEARVTNIAAVVDPATHRIAVRSEIQDPHHELRPQMLATFVIRTGQVQRSVAVPLDGVVREGDGTTDVFVTHDDRRFERRSVKLGIEQDGANQVVSGLVAGERVATAGALFLSNALDLQNR